MSEPVKGHTHLFLIRLRLGLDRHLDNRVRELHALQNDLIIGIAERIAGDDILKRSNGNDIARKGFLDVLATVGVHQKHTTDALSSYPSRY